MILQSDQVFAQIILFVKHINRFFDTFNIRLNDYINDFQILQLVFNISLLVNEVGNMSEQV